ncbi:MAG: SIS domain-containing protein [Candidatus Pacebacteria bacterium]|nr:SIS domain-containing protein [Candidatus Paceibacterota bacterium]
MDNFKNAILNFNKQLSPSMLRLSRLEKIKNSKPDSIIIVGMGGSGQAGFLISDLKYELGITAPVMVWENYDLPKINYKKPLFIFVSFSGNTAETLSGFSKAKLKAVVCSGGKLEQMADKSKSPIVVFSAGNLAPRQANGLMFSAIAQIIKAAFPKTKTNFSRVNPASLEKYGKQIAAKIKNKTILVYSSPENNHLSYVWKTNLNETAKAMAFSGTFPEMVHNEIVPFENRQKNTVILFLKNWAGQAGKKAAVVAKLLKKSGISSLEIKLSGKNNIEKTLNSVILAHWTSYCLAKIKKIDPAETKLIRQIKKLTN